MERKTGLAIAIFLVSTLSVAHARIQRCMAKWDTPNEFLQTGLAVAAHENRHTQCALRGAWSRPFLHTWRLPGQRLVFAVVSKYCLAAPTLAPVDHRAFTVGIRRQVTERPGVICLRRRACLFRLLRGGMSGRWRRGLVGGVGAACA